MDVIRLKRGWFGANLHIRVKSLKWLADLPGCDNGEVNVGAGALRSWAVWLLSRRCRGFLLQVQLSLRPCDHRMVSAVSNIPQETPGNFLRNRRDKLRLRQLQLHPGHLLAAAPREGLSYRQTVGAIFGTSSG
jgi:hypothetical protein